MIVISVLIDLFPFFFSLLAFSNNESENLIDLRGSIPTLQTKNLYILSAYSK